MKKIVKQIAKETFAVFKIYFILQGFMFFSLLVDQQADYNQALIKALQSGSDLSELLAMILLLSVVIYFIIHIMKYLIRRIMNAIQKK